MLTPSKASAASFGGCGASAHTSSMILTAHETKCNYSVDGIERMPGNQNGGFEATVARAVTVNNTAVILNHVEGAVPVSAHIMGEKRYQHSFGQNSGICQG